MRQDPIPVDVSDSAELLGLAEEVRSSGQARVLTHDGQALAVVLPATPQPRAKPRLRRRSKPIPRTSFLYNMIGMIDMPGPGDVSENKHRYVAQAYYEEFHPPEE